MSMPSENQIYRDSMEMPMEDLAAALWGVSNTVPPMDDHEIVTWAARKIKMMREMLEATGMSPALLKTCLEN